VDSDGSCGDGGVNEVESARAITAAVCTYGEAPNLLRALASLAEQDVAEGLTLEILCVDNNPAPRVSLPESLAAKVSIVREPLAGLSRARNVAIAHAQGDVIAFLDDDAVAMPGWAAALARAFGRTGAWCLGGRVLPEWPGDEPHWLDARLRYLLGLLDLGGETRLLRGPVFPCGANMAVRRFALDRVGLFGESLGRRPGSLLSGEEIDLFRRALRAGGTVAYVPDAVVYHIVPPSRLSSEFLRRRAWWEGNTLARLHRLDRGLAYTAMSALARAGLALVREPAAGVAAWATEHSLDLPICRARKVMGYWAGLFVHLDE
jgi:GT2 family glycosyltransferase